MNDENDAQVCRARNLVASYGRFSSAFSYLGPFLTSTALGETAGTSGVSQGAIAANPNPVMLAAGQTTGRTTLTWQANGFERVQVRVGSPTGTAMTGMEGPTGSAQTGDWVADGTMFYLQDASDGDSSGAAKTIANVRVRAISSTNGNLGSKSGTISAVPIRLPLGETMGATTLTWSATGVTQVQIRVNSPSGPLMTGLERPAGSATTGNWVTNGTIFYLQDATDGASPGAAKTIAAVHVRVTN